MSIYYAVYKGHNNGIFINWDECNKSVKGYSCPIFIKCKDIKDAEYFVKYGKIRENKTIDRFLNSNINDNTECDKEEYIIKNEDNNDVEKDVEKDDNKIFVYTDGSCYNNGMEDAIAGIGIYFGDNDKRNVSKQIDGKQSNNTAELKAIIEVYYILNKEIESDKEIIIYSDSIFAIRCCSSYSL